MTELAKRPCISMTGDSKVTVDRYVAIQSKAGFLIPPVYSVPLRFIVDREAYDEQMRRHLGLD